MDVIFKENGKCLYELVPENNAFFKWKPVRASYVDMLFGTEKVKGELEPGVLFAPEGKPLLLGLTDREPSYKALEMIDKDQWIITEIDGALVVTGWFDEATAAAARELYRLAQSDDVVLQLPITGRLEGYHLDIPTCTVGRFRGGMDCGDGAVTFRYLNAQKPDDTPYLDALTGAGYSLYQKNEISAHRFYTYTRGNTAVHISVLYTEMVELRICAGSTENLIPNETANRYAPGQIRPSLSGLNLYNRYADGNDIGMCLIFTLCDGSFIIYDGGHAADAEQLYRALTELNQRPDGKIVVAAWIFTHDHGDHTGAFAALSELPQAKQIVVETVVYSPNPAAYFWRSRFDPYHWACPEDLDYAPGRMAALASGYGGDTRILHPHMGQKLCIRDAVVEMLYTGCEDLSPMMVDNFNDTSLVSKVTLAGQTTLVLGDMAADAAITVILTLFGAVLNCDILQVSHHGLGGTDPRVYGRLKADVAIWPTTLKTIHRNDLMHRAHNAALLGRVKQTIVLDSLMYTLQLPFHAETDVPQERSIGTYNILKERQLMMIPRAKLADTMDGTVNLPRHLTISDDAYAEKAAKLLPLLLPQCSVSVAEEGILRAVRKDALVPEAYTLTAEPGVVRIGYSDYAGLRNALAAFSQLVRMTDDGFTIPAVKINDAPAVPHRGVMLDIARGVKDFRQFCSEMILMAKARMNVLHIHLSDGKGLGICLDSTPEAMRLPGAYTKTQVNELVELADVLGLELIPEYDMPAHSNSLLKALPELRCSVDPEEHTSVWTVCPGKEMVFQLFEKIIAEVCQLFPGKYFHMGGDELDFADVPKINQRCYWDLCPDCRKRMEEEGLADRSELYYYFVKRIHAMVSAQGRTLVMWSEQMDGSKEELLPKDIVMQFWRVAGKGRGPAHSCSMPEQLEKGYKVINSFYPQTYIDVESYLSEEKLRSWRWDRIPECSAEEAKGLVGTELCCWEYGNEAGYPHYWASLPSGIMLMADKLWNGDELPDTLEYSEALTRAVLGIGVPENFNIWPCFGGRIPPRTNKFSVYEDNVTATAIERAEVLAVLSDESRFAYNDFARACAYKARLENKPLEIPEPGVEPED